MRVFVGLAGTILTCKAQQTASDTTVGLAPVVVEAMRLQDFMSGKKEQTSDSTVMLFYASGSLSDILAEESPVFIKTYAPGMLATPAWRGGSAYHSPVVWNGIPLTSPMNGQTDFSLIPMDAAGSLRLDYGAGSALWGSGAVAGSVHLISRPAFGEGLRQKVRLSWGSFGDARQNVNLSFGSRRFSTVLKAFHASSRNNFPYRPPQSTENVITRLPHAQVNNAGIISENTLRLGRQQVINVCLWLQSTQRNIPPTLLQQESRASQEDRTARGLVSWGTEKCRFNAFVRTAWLQERLVYADPSAFLSDTGRTRQWISEAEGKIKFAKGHTLYAGLHNTHAVAHHRAYAERAVQNRFAQMLSYQYAAPDGRLSADLALRHELVDARPTPLNGTLSLCYRPYAFLGIKASLARVYRLPTLNDRFWRPGGNPDLKPESGYAGEGGLWIRWGGRMWKFTTEWTAYSRTVNHWIIWLPEGGYWTPRNLRRVWSRGAETSSMLSYQRGHFRCALTVLTSYVLSTPTLSLVPEDHSMGKQLIYTPMYTGMVRLLLSWKALTLAYRHNYIGYRYTSADNTQYLPPYHLGAVMISFRAIENRQTRLDVFLDINNVWNASYQVVSQRPMPGIQVQGGLSLDLNYPINHHKHVKH